MTVERVAAEAMLISLEALRLHDETGYSIRSGLYTAWRRLGLGASPLRLARRLLHEYSIIRRVAETHLKTMLGNIRDKDVFRLLTLLATASIKQINMGDPEKLALQLRSILGRRWKPEIEPYLGAFRSMRNITINPADCYPTWFTRYIVRLLGRWEALELMRFQNLESPPLYITLNTLLLPEEKILKHIEREGIDFEADGRLPGIYVVKGFDDPSHLRKAMDERLISVHDFSSYYAVMALNPRPGDKVLDVCAAPGTKTWLMAKLMKNRGRIISIDSSWNRVTAHLRRMRHMGVGNVEDISADATRPLPLTMKADKILIDPPCSSTGLFWREPGYRWSVKPRHVKMFQRLQTLMLESLSRNISRKGEILYSTCSITLEENEFVVEDFLKRHPEFELAEVEPKIGSKGMRGLDECRRLYPHKDRCNGFFLAKLVKRW